MQFDTDALIERRRLKRRVTIWRAATVIVLVAGLFTVASFFMDKGFGLPARPHIARINIQDVITEDRDRQEALKALIEDGNAKAAIVYINSPGGTTFGAEELYVALRKFGETRPVVAVIGTIGASGGYLTALAGDRIFARESTITGSIGVLFQTTEFSKLLDKVGVSAETITSGPLKAEPSPFKPLSERARAATQSMVNETFAWFKGLVMERRKMTEEEVTRVTDGRIFIGKIALGLKLIDEIGGEEEAVAWLAQEKGVDQNLPIYTLSWGTETDDWRELFSSIAGKAFLSERLSLDGLLAVWHPGH